MEITITTEETKSLKQVAIFLTRFTNQILGNSNGLQEFEIVSFIYSHIDKIQSEINDIKKETKILLKNDTNKSIWSFLENDPSLQRIVIRKLETIKSSGSGQLVAKDDLIKRNLFRKELSEYIGMVYTSHK